MDGSIKIDGEETDFTDEDLEEAYSCRSTSKTYKRR